MAVLDRRLTGDRKRWPQAPSEIAGIATLIALLEREKGTFHKAGRGVARARVYRPPVSTYSRSLSWSLNQRT